MKEFKLWPSKELKSWPTPPVKEEAERLCKIAYYLDKKFLRPIDLVELGIDVYRLKECGEVRMSKKPSQIKPHLAAIWGRMTEPMKAMFYWSRFCHEMGMAMELLTLIGDISKHSMQNELANLDAVLLSASRKLPLELQEKIKDGFGKEWRT